MRVIAPAGPFDRTALWRGLGWLSGHFRVRYDRGIFDRAGHFAGSDARRLAELNSALRCRESRAIIAARGGVGCTRIAHHADFIALREHPKWIVGYSDITALHCEAQRVGVASLHAHNVTGLGPGDAADRERWLQGLHDAAAPRRFGGLTMLSPGTAQGRLVGGNLTLLHDAALLGRAPIREGSVLFIEEVAEAPYRIDRLLTAIERKGVFDQIGGIVVGHLAGCQGAAGAVPLRTLFTEWAQRLCLPVAWGLSAGHARPNLPVTLGCEVRLADGELLTVPAPLP